MLQRIWLFNIIGFLSFLQSATMVKAEVPDTPPRNRWVVSNPTFTTDGLDLFLSYPISDYVPFSNLDIELYDGVGCSNGAEDITENDYLSFNLQPDANLTNTGSGNSWQVVTMSINFDRSTIRGSPILVTNGLEERLQFCVKINAYSAPPILPSAVALFVLETFVDVQITQDGDISVEQDVASARPVNTTETLRYRLRGYLCNETLQELIDPVPLFQGQPAQVCVTPDDEARAAGVYMRRIETFYWNRDTIYQVAIDQGQIPAQLTVIDCVPGMLICTFATLLKGDFFFRLGSVLGAGTGILQFGRGNYTGDQRYLETDIEFDFDDRVVDRFMSAGSQGLQVEDQSRGLQAEGTTSEVAGTGSFDVEVPVTRLYRAFGWLCNKNNERIDPRKNPITIDDLVRVCVTPDDIGIFQDDVRVRLIESFEWIRDDLNVTQGAINSTGVALPRTQIFCQPGSLVCALETDLKREFFARPGGVLGKGVVWLQYGEDSTDSRRTMAVDWEIDQWSYPSVERNLQFSLEDFAFGAQFLPVADPGFAGASPFEAVVFLLPPLEDRELYKCRVYECNLRNEEIVPFEQKTVGTNIRMCVSPDEDARIAGAKMWSIEWWQWSRTETRTQDAIVKQGKEAPDGRTVQFCYRGMDVCFFQTRLRDDFFSKPSPNVIEGNGQCWLTFEGGFPFPAPIQIADRDLPIVEIDPKQDILYAGDNPIRYQFGSFGNWTDEPPECPPEDHKLKEWWKEEDPKWRTLYIVAMVTTGIGICGVWTLCLLCNIRHAREDSEGGNGDVVVNLAMEDHKNTQSLLQNSMTRHQHRSVESDDSSEESDSGSDSDGDTFEDEPIEFSGKRSDRDVCFGDDSHPGTQRLMTRLRKILRDDPDEVFGPHIYKKMKKKMKGAFFLVRNRRRKWQEAKKSEVAAGMGEIWIEEKRQCMLRQGARTQEDLLDMEWQDEE